MESTEYHVPDDCTCGVLVSWRFFARAAGEIKFQVWEHIDSVSYKLKGENTFKVPSKSSPLMILSHTSHFEWCTYATYVSKPVVL